MAQVYDLTNVVCTVGGATVSGYGEDDAIEVEWDADIASYKTTADGRTIYSRLNQRGCVITITLMQTSRARLILEGLLETQHGDNVGIGPPLIAPLPFYLLDPATGEQLTSSDAVFLNRPAASKGKEVGEVEFRIHLPSPKRLPPVANVI
jgi:hypothetical protein